MRTLVNSIVRAWTGNSLLPDCVPDRFYELAAFARRVAPTVVVIVLNLFR